MTKKTAILICACSFLVASCNEAQNEMETAANKQPIIHGSVDDKDPAVVGLFREVKNEKDEIELAPGCTGTLIHPQWVLTAAHCVVQLNKAQNDHELMDYRSQVVLLGTSAENGKVIAKLSDERTKIYWHHDYLSGEEQIFRDIALIKLPEPISQADIPEPILPLPSWLALQDKDLPISCRTVGFGYDEFGEGGRKLVANIPITNYCHDVDNVDDVLPGCNVGKRHIVGVHPNMNYQMNKGYIDDEDDLIMSNGSLYLDAKDSTLCNGDSGGPAVITVGGKEYVGGVASYGSTICSVFNVSTAVQDYYNWIVSLAPEVASQYREICGNGVDDDGNGLTDDEDYACLFCKSGTNADACNAQLIKDGKNKCIAWDDQKYQGGDVKCDDSCHIDFSQCELAPKCGNHQLDQGEECDGPLFVDDKQQCSEYNSEYARGWLRCDHECKLTLDRCQRADECGNKYLNGNQYCDRTTFVKEEHACVDYDSDLYNSGYINCDENCLLDDSECGLNCGNGVVDTDKGEICDDKDLNGATCETIYGPGAQGFLACLDCYHYMPLFCSNPAQCGDGHLQLMEECDGELFAPKDSCSKLEPDRPYGVLKCNDDCTIDTSSCVATLCGNGTLDEGEVCDGALFSDSDSCQAHDASRPIGKVTCKSDCTVDTSSCVATLCGNGTLDEGEACDGELFNTGMSCEAVMGQGYTGKLTCSADCQTVSTERCIKPADQPEPAPFSEICDDDIDNDQNGQIDCEDEACKSFDACYSYKAKKQTDCSANPLNSAENAPWAWLLLLPIVGLMRRRRCE